MKDKNQNSLVNLGIVRKTKHGNILSVKCYKCADDPELNGDAVYNIYESNYNKGVLPCGCSSAARWNDDQWVIRFSRAAKLSGLTFLSFYRKTPNKITVRLLCDDHGEYETDQSSLLSGKGCRRCKSSKSNLKEDHVMIKSFLASGKFPSNTKFQRSSRVDCRGARVYWTVSCPTCNGTFESSSSHLQKGQLGCACKGAVQKTSYVLSISDGYFSCLKFGITSDIQRRLNEIRNSTSLDVDLISVWKYEDVQSCLKAERTCKSNLTCGVIPKSDLGDGYSETTHLYNLETILGIFKENGGVLC